MRDAPEHLAARYAAMNEGELLHLAGQFNELTLAAQSLLRAEFARRCLEMPSMELRAQPEARALTTIRRYRDLTEAMIARSLLETAGIPVWIQDENLVRMDWFYSNAVGGVRLQVESGDEAAARELLDQPVPESITFGGSEEFVQPTCPKCGSLEVSFLGAGRQAALPALALLSIPLPLGGETWACDACGAAWEEIIEPKP